MFEQLRQSVQPYALDVYRDGVVFAFKDKARVVLEVEFVLFDVMVEQLNGKQRVALGVMMEMLAQAPVDGQNGVDHLMDVIRAHRR